MTIGQNIKSAREAAGISQAELAKRVGTVQVQIGKYERDLQYMSVMRLIDIAKALNIPPESLLE